MASDLQMVFQTRYSFFGSSGWQSDVSKQKEKLFDPARLDKRLYLFERMNLASLRDQTDADFKLLVLTSHDLPSDHMRRLSEACHDTIGAERTFITARKPGSAGAWMRKCMRNHLNTTSHSAQIVLDDDDAVSIDFVERCRAEAQFALSQLRPDQDCTYLSFATGLTGRFEQDGGLNLIPREVPFTNLGLTLVAPTRTRRNPYMLAHKKVARRYAVRVIHDQRPFFIRSVHDTNDSRAHHGDEILGADAVEQAKTWFPLLQQFDLIATRKDLSAAA